MVSMVTPYKPEYVINLIFQPCQIIGNLLCPVHHSCPYANSTFTLYLKNGHVFKVSFQHQQDTHKYFGHLNVTEFSRLK